MVDVPETEYATGKEGGYRAYQVIGDGPLDLVVPVNGGMPLDLIWEDPTVSNRMGRLASFSRLILLEPTGFGCSSRVDPTAVPAIQTWMDDLAAVMDAVGTSKAAFLSWAECSLAVMLFAATNPDRVSSLVFVNAYARYVRSEECPWGMPADRMRAYAAAIQKAWGTGMVMATLAPSLVQGEQALRFWARAERLSGPPDAAAAISRAFMQSDVSDVLPAIQAPTLVISRRDDRHVRFEHGRYLARRIPHARLVELEGDDNLFLAGHADEILDEAQEFITGVRPTPVFDRVLATVLFTDIVDSTARAIQLGDRAWRETLNRYDDLVEHELARFRGRHVNTTGDGTVATFDGPARAIECGRAITRGVRTLGLEVRAGLHTGEVEARGDDIAGIAVHVAARVSSIANAGEVLVSRTVTDLVAGSGIRFGDRGEHALKGVPGTWQLFAVEVNQSQNRE